MQTYAVLLNGALLGRWGAVSTTIYVLMVAVGAPFGANHLLAPLWSYGGGALGSSSGGYFIGEPSLHRLVHSACSAMHPYT